MKKSELIAQLEAIPGDPEIITSVFGHWARGVPACPLIDVIPVRNKETGIITYWTGNIYQRIYGLHRDQEKLEPIKSIVL